MLPFVPPGIFNFHLDPFTAEATALFYAAKFCKDLDLTPIMLEGDAMQVVQILTSSEPNWSNNGLIIQETKSLLNSFATRREGNMMAHLLAKYSMPVSSTLVEFDVIPECVKDILYLDFF